MLKNAVFCDVAAFLRNVGSHKIYMAPPPWKPKILLKQMYLCFYIDWRGATHRLEIRVAVTRWQPFPWERHFLVKMTAWRANTSDDKSWAVSDKAMAYKQLGKQ
jgi:hypothetical protein